MLNWLANEAQGELVLMNGWEPLVYLKYDSELHCYTWQTYEQHTALIPSAQKPYQELSGGLTEWQARIHARAALINRLQEQASDISRKLRALGVAE